MAAERIILGLNGIPGTQPIGDDENGFIQTPDGAWIPLHGNLPIEIETICVHLHDHLAARIFGSIENYYSLLPFVNSIHYETGLNSESNLPKVEFEKILTALAENEEHHKLFYLYDCRRLVFGIQECTKEIGYLMGEFYRSLNLDELFFPPMVDPDGLRYLTSATVTKIHAMLGFIYIRLHSLMDYATKLAFEVENLAEDFKKYPKMSSRDKQYGDRKKLSLNDLEGSLFERCLLLTEIESVRNLIIHDGYLDDMPKVYKVVKDGVTVEKFILFPDRNEHGRFEHCINRDLFFGDDDKINLRLPKLIQDFQTRLLVTLSATLNLLK